MNTSSMGFSPIGQAAIERRAMAPVFIVGNMRSGTTVLHKTLLQAIDAAVDIDPSDLESRPFWMKHGIQCGTILTGTFCAAASADTVSEETKARIRSVFNKASARGSRVITKNVHFCNKIPLLHELFPDALYIHILRQDLSVVASMKKAFTNFSEGKTLWGTSCIHYWPDEPRPCWNVLSRQQLPQRRVVKEKLRRLVTHRSLILTPAFADWTAFRKEHPDPTRYFPGGGFQRLEESWVKSNHNILLDVKDLGLAPRYLAINYHSMVEKPKNVFRAVADFLGVKYKSGSTFENLTAGRQDKWQHQLTAAEIEICKTQRENFSLEGSILAEKLPGPVFAA
ncbi:MAG: sulfotransferase [Chthoniobacterales bacterium]